MPSTKKKNIEELLSLCHIDGKMDKTTKSTLMEELEKSGVSNNPEMVDVVIVEEFFFHHLLSDSPETFEFSRSKLRKLFFFFCQIDR